jgi:hypothetical protein
MFCGMPEAAPDAIVIVRPVALSNVCVTRKIFQRPGPVDDYIPK